MVMGGLIHNRDEVMKTAGSNPRLVAGNNDGPSAIPDNVSGIYVRSQEGQGGQCSSSTVFVDLDGKMLLREPVMITETSDKLKFSAENHVLAETCKDASPEALQLQEIRLVDRNSREEIYQTNQRKEEYLSKGKGKVLSNGDIKDEIADDNGSHGSAGSCNSRNVASSRNTKRSRGQQLVVTSKRLRQSTERDTDSAFFIRQSSSFMSWITNMVKGYPGCNPDDAPSSMLASMLTTHSEQSPKHVGHEHRDVGFRKFFRSICCSNNSVKGRKIYADYRSNEASGDVKHPTNVDVSAVPLTAYKTSDNIPEDSGQASKICDQPISGNHVARPSNQCICRSLNFSTKVAKRMEIDIASEYSEKKEAQPIGQKRDYLGSLWITRFRPKISQPESDIITSKLINKRVLINLEKNVSIRKGPMDEVHEQPSPGDLMSSHTEGHNGTVKHEVLGCSGQVNVKDEQNLEVMASVFARRLDALKQVVPFDATCKPAPMTTTCFFCGVRGHGIQACSEITESEIGELFHVIKSYDKFKDSTCLCIKCFRLNHWAIERPQRPSRKSAIGSFVDWSNDIDFYSYRRAKEERRLLEKIDNSIGTLASSVNVKPDTDAIQLHDSSKLNQSVADAWNSHNPVSGGWEAGESSSLPQHKISAAMENIFDAVKRLRLSRSDFIRLLDSPISSSYLRGLYLRVRLRNCKEGLDGKGYYVACIHSTATNRGELNQAGHKTSVGVTIGSFTCLVESRHISNQDFHEDELMAWWRERTKCGHTQNPSVEELKQKYEERQKLGF